MSSSDSESPLVEMPKIIARNSSLTALRCQERTKRINSSRASTSKNNELKKNQKIKNNKVSCINFILFLYS